MAAYFAERARGGVGMIITGGISPNAEGGHGAKLATAEEAAQHRIITEAVHNADPDVKICMQILHAGPLAFADHAVAPSAVKSRISPAMPTALDEAGIEKQLADFANCASRAREAGYDGVEIIGSAGYLLSTFLVEKTNQRTDQWGGSYENRMRFPRRGGAPYSRRGRRATSSSSSASPPWTCCRAACPGTRWCNWDRQSRRPAPISSAPTSPGTNRQYRLFPPACRAPPLPVSPGAWPKSWAFPPLPATASICPRSPEQVLAAGHADLVSMARPMLADAEFVNKAQGRS